MQSVWSRHWPGNADWSDPVIRPADSRTPPHQHADGTDAPQRRGHQITKDAGIGTNWTPHELRHSFVSIMSDQGVPIEIIADLVGHAGTSVTEAVYRHQLRPVITKGAHTMNTIFGDKPTG
ncbi:tyrosine-type recombinase/integrase [Nonomuraea sp. B19D2]|uniref:tyrosine-type recombinase/integrase n=1 Tax=Nonomuraea sp. B19D2 TaxID=3159561 RepID=UPI0032DA43EA